MTESIVLGGGCFWCTEAVIKRLRGVVSVVPGYAGGNTLDPDYEQVSTGQTGHAEVIKVEFDPTRIGLEMILEVFFATHDPTSMNRQGADVGTQYGSVILFDDEAQEKIVRKVVAGLKDTFDSPIVTEIKKLDKFYPAEEYHRNYYERNEGKPYCQLVINPKLSKLRAKYAHLLVK